MNDVEQDLARKLAAHPKWKWMRGMFARKLSCPASTHINDTALVERDGDSPGRCIPDLSCPATQGCLWAMLCESPRLYERTIGGKVRCHTVGSAEEWPGSRGEALARALLSAWGNG